MPIGDSFSTHAPSRDCQVWDDANSFFNRGINAADLFDDHAKPNSYQLQPLHHHIIPHDPPSFLHHPGAYSDELRDNA
jgi:hypothetical protein